jgi:hypothetical protein
MTLAPDSICTFTMGYSDGEDRVWVRAVLAPPREAQLWLTRALTLKIAQGVADLLVKTAPPPTENAIPELAGTIQKAKLAAEYQQAKANPSDREAPPPPDPSSVVQAPGGLCSSVDIRPGQDASQPWVFVWKTPSFPAGYLLSLPRPSVLKLTAGLVQQAQIAGWSFPAEIETGLGVGLDKA